MPYFSILCFDHDESLELRRQLQHSYQSIIEKLQSEGRLLYAGDMLKASEHGKLSEGYHGSIAVADFANIESAKAWIVQHPYTTADVFANIEICAYQPVLSNEEVDTA